jgi:uncharacterized protein YndB with AHSA1/START domain
VKWVLLVLAGLAALVVLVFLVGLLLPREHVAASRVTLAQPVDSVWAVVDDPRTLLGVWPELTEVTRLPDREGKAVWREKVGGWEMTLVVEESDPPRRLVGRIDAAPDAAFGGRWVYDLAPVPGGTTLTVTEEGWIANPAYRSMAAVMGLHRSLDQYLRAVGRKFGEEVRPEHVR